MVAQGPGMVAGMDGEELPVVTASLLRRVDDLCRRRLAHELRGGKRRANKTADMRFAVSNRIEADARLAQSELGPPRAEAFVEPRELEPEQQALYRAGARGYLDAFGSTRARVIDIGWRTVIAELGVELMANVGLAAELDDGRRELRKVSVGGRRPGSPLLDPVDLRAALVRSEAWAPDELELVAVDVIDVRMETHVPDLGAEREEARTWIGERVARVLELADDGRPRAGSDCQGCAFIAGCPAHAS